MSHTPRFGPEEWNLVYGVALRVVKSPDQAEDVAQEALIRAYRARDSYEGRARFNSWLYRIAYTTALSYLRSPHRRLRHRNQDTELGREGVLARITDDAPAPDELLGARQLATSMQGCLNQMRDLDRVAFTERFLRGTSEKELGELLGVSTNAAKQRAFRARQAVRQCVSAAFEPPRDKAA